MSALLKTLKHSMVALAIGGGATLGLTASGAAQADARAVVFVGNNWDGTVNVFDSSTC